MGLTGISLFAVGVRVENDRLYLLYTYSHTPKTTVAMLRENLGTMQVELECNYAVIYNNAIYPFYNPTNATMIDAIVRGIKPGLAALVT
jgi:hypothetical protein